MINKVLGIEDDTTTHFLNEIKLKQANFCHEYIKVYNGEQAIDYFQQLSGNFNETAIDHLPEVILLDLNMPVMDGWEFLELYQEQFPQFASRTKLYILTSSINPKDKEKANNSQIVTAFLEKPLDDNGLNRINDDLSKEN